ncbi:MAG: SH3 domain-containing protein, partial [Lachnospiraceae bacterium]|nr:SH3 domain-containing protein [Lachnospiraceae bacterium]
MLRGRRILILLAGLILCLSISGIFCLNAEAAGQKEYLDSLSVGITQIIDPTTGTANEEAIKELTELAESNKPQAVEESDLVMVNVQVAMNVRAEASEESDKVGLLYKDCGGRILERKDGWTRLKSGDLIGWASDEYLLFGEEAEAMADDVGNQIVTIETEILRVRDEPNTDAEVVGLLTGDDELEIIEFVNDDWISVDYE